MARLGTIPRWPGWSAGMAFIMSDAGQLECLTLPWTQCLRIIQRAGWLTRAPGLLAYPTFEGWPEERKLMPWHQDVILHRQQPECAGCSMPGPVCRLSSVLCEKLCLCCCIHAYMSTCQMQRDACYCMTPPRQQAWMSLKHTACCTCNICLVPLQAEQDCTEALAADATFIKAWHRRGTARRAQGKPLEAAEDFEAALRLEPGSVALAKDRWGIIRPVSLWSSGGSGRSQCCAIFGLFRGRCRHRR